MLRQQKIILIGPCGGGDVPKNGASAKNYHLAGFLQEMGAHLKVIDTENWKRNPMILLRMLGSVILDPKASIIISANSMSSYRTLQIFSMLPRKRHVIYWVIGGSIANWIKQGMVKTEPYRIVSHFLVEGRKMQATLKECGFDNAIVVPNFKNIDYIPVRQQRTDDKVRFVFLSRIIPQKGCGMIIDAVKRLNPKYKDRFLVDFYGPIEESYREEFIREVESQENVRYGGFLDLSNTRNYDTLALYDVMLFPSYWAGEGFPGIAIDAFIAGLPVIATDWSLNADIIEHERLGLCIDLPLKKGEKQRIFSEDEHPFDTALVVENLARAMQYLIDNPQRIEQMSANCRQEAQLYNTSNVLTWKLFEQIGLIV